MILADMLVMLWVLFEQFIWACLDKCSGVWCSFTKKSLRAK
jgi:hypothetical protein